MNTTAMRPARHRAATDSPCELWRVDLASIGFDESVVGAAVDEARRLAIARHLDPADRRARLVAHALLRLRASALLACDPTDLPWAVDPGGKPRLPGTGLEFSLSHCRTGVCVAFSWRAAVGVDIEAQRPFTPTEWEDLVQAALTPQEQRDVMMAVVAPAEVRASASGGAWSSPDHGAAFLRRWTLKEAVIKATGEGLARPLHTLEVRPDAQPPEVHFLDPADPQARPQWGLSQWMYRDHVVALARRGLPAMAELQVFEIDPAALQAWASSGRPPPSQARQSAA